MLLDKGKVEMLGQYITPSSPSSNRSEQGRNNGGPDQIDQRRRWDFHSQMNNCFCGQHIFPRFLPFFPFQLKFLAYPPIGQCA